MSLTLPTLRRRRPAAWNETDAAALAVADVNSIHITASAVRTVIAGSLRAHGGPEGVRAELDRRLADTPQRTARVLDWARRTVAAVASQ